MRFKFKPYTIRDDTTEPEEGNPNIDVFSLDKYDVVVIIVLVVILLILPIS